MNSTASSRDGDFSSSGDAGSDYHRPQSPDASSNAPEYTNYLDVKLERIENLPSDWFDLAEAPAYHQHPFRYEVSIATPLGVPIQVREPEEKKPDARRGSAHRSKSNHSTPQLAPSSAAESVVDPAVKWMSFKRGRILQLLPQYKRYVDAAVAQTLPGMDEVNPIRDIPETIDVPGVTPDTMRDTQTSSAAPTSRVSFLSNGEMPPAPVPVIMWIVTDSTDVAAPPPDDANQKKGKRKVQQSNVVQEIIPPSLPEKDDPPPCVFRIPLDAEQEAYLESLLSIGKPLNLTFKRVLKEGLPPEWEDLNAAYFEAIIPVSVYAFAEPGSLKLTSVASLEPCFKRPANPVDTGVKKKPRRAKLGQPATLIEEPDFAAVHPYVANTTTAVVSLGLQRTLARLASDRVRPNVTPAQLIPTREYSGDLILNTPQDVTGEFTEVIESIARKILRDFKDSTSESALKANATLEEKEAWRARFLEFFQSTGQLDTYKAQLTPLVVRVAQDKFLRSDASVETLSELSNELYVYLLDAMHSTLLRVVNKEVNLNDADQVEGRASPGEACMSPIWKFRAIEAEISREYSLASKYHQARIASNEDPDAFPSIWTDAAEFYIRACDSKAEQCYREAIACSPQCLPALLGYGMWLMSYQRLNEAAVFLHGVVDISPQYSLAWGCISLLDDMFLLNVKKGNPHYHTEMAKWQKEQRYALNKALEFCVATFQEVMEGSQLEIDLHPDRSEDVSGEITTTEPATDSKTAEESETPRESVSLAKFSTEGHSQGNEGSTYGHPPNGSQGVSCTKELSEETEAQEDRVFLQVADYAIHLQHPELANLCLAHCRQGRKEVQRLYARLFVQCEQYDDAIEILNVLSSQLRNTYDSLSLEDQMLVDEYLILRAECEVGRGNSEEAIFFYKEALCKNLSSLPHYMLMLENVETFSPENTVELSPNRCEEDAPRNRRLFFSRGYLQLGNLLLSEGKVRDALGVFTLGIQCWNCGLMWLGAGIAYFRMGEYEAAEESLNESNIRNPLNPRTWAYLALLCVRTRRDEVEELVQRVMIQGLSDPALWAEIGRELLSANRPQLGEVCLRKSIVLEEAEHPPSRGKSISALVSSSKYHLSHALTAMQRWEEARAVMREVVMETTNEVLKQKAEEELKGMQSGVIAS